MEITKEQIRSYIDRRLKIITTRLMDNWDDTDAHIEASILRDALNDWCERDDYKITTEAFSEEDSIKLLELKEDINGY